MVEWMGHRPYKITYSSDYFDQLFEFAIQLIKDGKAYVDGQTAEEMSKSREERTDSPWRDRRIEESLREFELMRKGYFEENERTLRLKMDMKNDNPVMRDLVAYRIKYAEHPHAGRKWCIYPTYDYTHCIIDSLENITHSLCTLEFLVRRESYYWLLDAIGLYKPVVWEFSRYVASQTGRQAANRAMSRLSVHLMRFCRLNVSNFIMSKRKLKQLVKNRYVDGWDDPRLPTLTGELTRRSAPY